MAVSPQLEPGGGAGKGHAEQRPQRHVAMGIDDGLGNFWVGRLGQCPHRCGAGHIGRDARNGADEEQNEAALLHLIVVGRERHQEEEQREHEAGGRQVVQDDVDVRPERRRRSSSPSWC